MPKGFTFCPCFGNDTTDYAEPELDPVLLVSGIGGSILNSKTKDKGVETRVWVRILLADYTFQKRIWSLYNPNTGYTEVLDQSTELVVPDDDYGLFAIDILDPSLFVKLFHVTELYNFHDMIDMLIKCGYKKGTTLFGYGYDFRQSNRIDKSMEGLKAKLETAYKASGNRRVNIISHSMGGLLVSCFMSLYPDVFSKFVSKWTCIACPFQGSPGCINDALLTGLQFVEGFESYFFVSRWTMHQLLVECPSIYEMLANPGFSWESPPQVQVWRKKSDDEETCTELVSYGPLDCVTLFYEALKNNELTLNAAQLSKGVSFYNIFGTSNDTPFDVRYGTETSPIEDLSIAWGKAMAVSGDQTNRKKSNKDTTTDNSKHHSVLLEIFANQLGCELDNMYEMELQFWTRLLLRSLASTAKNNFRYCVLELMFDVLKNRGNRMTVDFVIVGFGSDFQKAAWDLLLLLFHEV